MRGFSLESGMRQRCLLSLFLSYMVLEALAIAMRFFFKKRSKQKGHNSEWSQIILVCKRKKIVYINNPADPTRKLRFDSFNAKVQNQHTKLSGFSVYQRWTSWERN